MKLFEDSRGFLISFGFDMLNRVKAPNMVTWCDPSTKDWEMKDSNQAGWNHFPFSVVPEFVHECSEGIIAYSPGQCLVMTYVGGSTVWKFTVLKPNE